MCVLNCNCDEIVADELHLLRAWKSLQLIWHNQLTLLGEDGVSHHEVVELVLTDFEYVLTDPGCTTNRVDVGWDLGSHDSFRLNLFENLIVDELVSLLCVNNLTLEADGYRSWDLSLLILAISDSFIANHHQTSLITDELRPWVLFHVEHDAVVKGMLHNTGLHDTLSLRVNIGKVELLERTRLIKYHNGVTLVVISIIVGAWHERHSHNLVSAELHERVLGQFVFLLVLETDKRITRCLISLTVIDFFPRSPLHEDLHHGHRLGMWELSIIAVSQGVPENSVN